MHALCEEKSCTSYATSLVPGYGGYRWYPYEAGVAVRMHVIAWQFICGNHILIQRT